MTARPPWTLEQGALLQILARARQLRRSCAGWRDAPGATPPWRMTRRELWREFADLEAMARVGLGDTPEQADAATRR